MARPFPEVQTDVRRGFVSIEEAGKQYGVALREDLTVDESESVPRAAF